MGGGFASLHGTWAPLLLGPSPKAWGPFQGLQLWAHFSRDLPSKTLRTKLEAVSPFTHFLPDFPNRPHGKAWLAPSIGLDRPEPGCVGQEGVQTSFQTLRAGISILGLSFLLGWNKKLSPRHIVLHPRSNQSCWVVFFFFFTFSSRAILGMRAGMSECFVHCCIPATWHST